MVCLYGGLAAFVGAEMKRLVVLLFALTSLAACGDTVDYYGDAEYYCKARFSAPADIVACVEHPSLFGYKEDSEK